jgi:hypothetical protein
MRARGWVNKRRETKKGRKLGGRPFDKATLYQLLTNPTYTGKMRYKDELHAGEHEAIIDQELFDMVQKQLKLNGRTGGAEVRNKYGALLRGLLRCKRCGAAMAPRGSGGYIEIKADPKGHRNDIYRKIERWLKAECIPVDGTRVLQASFHLKFQHNGAGRQPTLTFDVSVPNSSNLKSKPDEQREVGERCLKLWEVVADDDDKG